MSWIETIGIWLRNYSSPRGTIYVSLDVHHNIAKRLNLFYFTIYSAFYIFVLNRNKSTNMVLNHRFENIARYYSINNKHFRIKFKPISKVIFCKLYLMDIVWLYINIWFTVMHLIRNKIKTKINLCLMHTVRHIITQK